MWGYVAVTLTAFAIAVVLGWVLIPMLRKKKIGQNVRDVGPKSHLSKAGTPTMGGVIFVLSAFLAALLFMPRSVAGYLVLFVTMAYGSIGFADDYLKVFLRQALGLKARQKLLGQLLAAVLFYIALRLGDVEHSVMIPWLGDIYIAWLYPLWVIAVLIGTSNAVNLSDGVDGLAGGLGVITMLGFAVIGGLMGVSEIVYISLAMAGGILGFLVFNLHPARIFMGDTGSLALGGAIAALAVITRTELLLLLFLGIIFVLETVSVIIQVTYFRFTGRRVFLMAPIHHHFELKGWSEWKICLVFWSVQGLCVVVGILVMLASYR